MWRWPSDVAPSVAPIAVELHVAPSVAPRQKGGRVARGSIAQSLSWMTPVARGSIADWLPDSRTCYHPPAWGPMPPDFPPTAAERAAQAGRPSSSTDPIAWGDASFPITLSDSAGEGEQDA